MSKATTITSPIWVTVQEAATYASLSTKTVRRMIDAGTLTATYATPRALRVSLESLKKHLAAHATRREVA